MFQMPFSRRGVTYPMASSVYYRNLVVLSVLLVGSVVLYAVGQGSSDASVQLQAAGSYAMPVSIYLFAALIGMIVVRRSSMTVPAVVQSGCRAASLLAVMTLVAALVPYLAPEPPQGMTLPAVLFWSVLGLPIVDVALGLAYAVAWAPVTGSPEDLAAREAEERRRDREAKEEMAAMKASSEARARRREERARRAEEKRAAKGEKGAGEKGSAKGEKGTGEKGPGQRASGKKASGKRGKGKRSRK